MSTADLMTLASTLRERVLARIDSEQDSRNSLANGAKVGGFTLSRWLDEPDKDIKTSTASRLAAYLGLRVVPAIESAEPSIESQLRAAVAARIEQGETRYSIAKGAGIMYATIARWLDENRDPALSTADKLAEYLGVSLEPLEPE